MADSEECRHGTCDCIAYDHATIEKCKTLLNTTLRKVKMKRTSNLHKTLALKQLMRELIKYAKQNQIK